MDALTFVTDGKSGFAKRKIPMGSTLRIDWDGTLFKVERSNGFVISGYPNGDRRQLTSVDLRCESASILCLVWD